MRLLRSRRFRWLAAVLAVAALVFSAIAVTLGTANRQRADDPRSTTRSGAGALGALLGDAGVQLSTTDRVDQALDRTDAATTVVVADAERLSPAESQQLARAPMARLILLRPSASALQQFEVPADDSPPEDGTFAPGCADDGAQLAGAVTFDDMRASYRGTGPATGCYPAGGGFAFLRTATAAGVPVDLVAGGISNAQLGREGNAAWAMNVFGGHPKVVWLVARVRGAAADGGAGRPTLLPPWWEIAVVQAAIALVVVGIWRGRRLGPILSEPLPVRVRAAETVEGHGRLYDRLNARDRAAEALRMGARTRLSRAFGHDNDPLALSEAVGSRTGRGGQQVRTLLFGPAPNTDDQLVTLTTDLDRLEQEARTL